MSKEVRRSAAVKGPEGSRYLKFHDRSDGRVRSTRGCKGI